jgi:hypothetical protein
MPKTGQMKQTKFLKGECQHCRGHIDFPAESAGLTTDCPHCGKQTELFLSQPKDEPTIPRATIVYTIIAVIILGAGLAGAIVALKMAERKVPHKRADVVAQVPVAPMDSTPDPHDVIAQTDFRISTVTLEKIKGSSLVYAVGTLTNTADRQRFGVRAQFDLLDENGTKVGDAKDYQQVIEPHGEWKFRALVVAAKVASAKIASVTEEK